MKEEESQTKLNEIARMKERKGERREQNRERQRERIGEIETKGIKKR